MGSGPMMVLPLVMALSLAVHQLRNSPMAEAMVSLHGLCTPSIALDRGDDFQFSRWQGPQAEIAKPGIRRLSHGSADSCWMSSSRVHTTFTGPSTCLARFAWRE
jgi:hypothetical protein